MKKLLKRLYKNYSSFIRNIRLRKTKKLFAESDLTILSSDCVGGVLYNDIGMPFLSPTINMYFDEKNHSFLRMCKDLDKYLEYDLKAVNSTLPFPVFQLSDGWNTNKTIDLFFMHYESTADAFDSWNRRKLRVTKNRVIIYLKFLLDQTDIQLLESIPYPKFVITSNKSNRVFLKKEYVHISKHLSKIDKNDGRIMSFTGIRGSRRYDDLNIIDFLKLYGIKQK